jgi:hypothetical protein
MEWTGLIAILITAVIVGLNMLCASLTGASGRSYVANKAEYGKDIAALVEKFK